MDYQELKTKTQGRWYSILTSAGIPASYLDGKPGPCPITQAGVDRFVYDDKDGNGSWFCRVCSPHRGDGIGLIQKVIGLSFIDAKKIVMDAMGEGGNNFKMDKAQTKPGMSETDKKEMLNKIWNSSTDLQGGDQVSKYLHSRKLVLQPDNVRCCLHCYESDTKQHYAAMVAKFMTPDGVPVALHRTYLAGDSKANIESPKKITPTTAPMAGGAVRLFSPADKLFEDGVLGIGEGIESCIAAAQIFGIATWAALSTSLLESFEPPEEYRRIVIFGDNDASFAGAKSAYVLANKLYRRDLLVSVEIPPKTGQDFNNVLIEMSK